MKKKKKHEPFVCELRLPESRYAEAAAYVEKWNDNAAAAKAAYTTFVEEAATEMSEHMSTLGDKLQQRLQRLVDDAESDNNDDGAESDGEDTVSYENDEFRIGVREAGTEESNAIKETMQRLNELREAKYRQIAALPSIAFAHEVRLSISRDADARTDDTCVVIVISPRDEEDHDTWSATVSAMQYLVDNLRIEKPIQITWSHHDPKHGGDCRHVAIIQANAEPVLSVVAENVEIPQPRMNTLGRQSGWCQVDVPHDKYELAAKAVNDWLAKQRDTRLSIAKLKKQATVPFLAHASDVMARVASNVHVFAYRNKCEIPPTGPLTEVDAILIGHSDKLSRYAAARAMSHFADALQLDRPLVLKWIGWSPSADEIGFDCGVIVAACGMPPDIFDVEDLLEKRQ